MQKLFNKLLIVDASYNLHKNLKVPELFELRNPRNGQRSGGTFGFLRSLNFMMSNPEYFPVLCWDSGLSSRRLEVYPDYKHNLSKQKDYKLNELAEKYLNDPSSINSNELSSDDITILKDKVNQMMNNRRTFGSLYSDDDYMYQYRTQRNVIIDICNSLGIPSIKIKGWEGDDLMTILSRMSMRSTIVTDDKDLIQLLSPSTDINRVVNKQYLTYDQYLSDHEMKTIREMIIIKAITGDSSDAIPGVADGLGGKTAAIIARTIIDNEEDPNKYLPILAEDTSRARNRIKKFVDNHDNYLRNMKLVDLSLVNNEYEIVDQIISEIKSKVGTSNMMASLSKLGEQSITNVDVNSIINKVILSSRNALL